MREPGSRSRCPAHYSRPRVLVVRSPRARGARSGLLARYVGGHLALGGYADVDVRPWRDDAAPPPEEAAAPPADAPVKDPARTSRGGALLRRAAPRRRPTRVRRARRRPGCRGPRAGTPVATTRGEVLGRADLRPHENRPDAPLAAARPRSRAWPATTRPAAGRSAKSSRRARASAGAHLACEPEIICPRSRPRSPTRRDRCPTPRRRGRRGAGRRAGALLRRSACGGPTAPSSSRAAAGPRSSARRRARGRGSGAHDLVSTAGLPLVFERRARLARLAWSHALLYAPLPAAHAACAALPAEARATAAAAAREARLALGAADRAARRAARAALADGGRARAAPTPVCARRAGRPTARPRSRPPWRRACVALARPDRAPRAGFPAGGRAGNARRDAAPASTAGVLEALEAACAPETPSARRGAAARARDPRVTRAPADAARLFEAAGRPRAVSRAARRALRGSLAAAVALMLLAGGAACSPAARRACSPSTSLRICISHAMALSISCLFQLRGASPTKFCHQSAFSCSSDKLHGVKLYRGARECECIASAAAAWCSTQSPLGRVLKQKCISYHATC